MRKIASELYRTVVSVKRRQIADGVSSGQADSLDITFSGQSRLLLRVLSESFEQSEEEFASTLLHHALSESLKIIPDVLSKEDFVLLESQLINKLGLEAYLSFRPIFPFKLGVSYPNFAEVSTKAGVSFGQWFNEKDQISIGDPITGKTLYIYPKSIKPEVSIDAVTLQWEDTNLKPVYVHPVATGDLIEDLDRADILFILGIGYFHREDEYLDDYKFVSYSNTSEDLTSELNLRASLKTDQLSNGTRVEITPEAIRVAKPTKEGSWEIENISIQAYTMQNVIIDPAE